ncbi:glycosyltransferase family 4 protein [Desulfosporosinus sp. PR]|uniref:glycosyltransferase family 4 protein n=1 Tax=Candidatus Desulfosporosinus nitrosoreducens TaxID=3401928 RepID=UPI0027EEB702|nr:glycosyltransferase family 4 protein [Desulfosporosinus sp. PR]MDQ7092677.1 glycosyltransferase family 4 protein [Desulfosporosinus sp. PR]
MICLKVLSLTNEFAEESFGGAGTAATGMLQMLDRWGIQQTVIVARSDWVTPRWDLRGCRMNVLGLPRSQYFGYLGMINSEAALQTFPELKQEWDLIHCHAINFIPLAYTLSKGTVPILYTVYSFLRKELGDGPEPELQAQFKIQEDLLMRCQRIHLISQSERNYLTERYPQYFSKTEVLPLGITCPQEHWQPESTNEFLYVGRLLDYKGIEDLIQAVWLVKQSGRQARLNIIGKGAAYYEDHLRRLVQSKKLGSWIKFYGWQPSSELWRWMGRSAALVVPSRREAYGLVALEGMSIGIPIIASRAGGLAELVSDSCALTFEPGNVKQLADTLRTAIDNPVFLKSLAANGHEKALSLEWERLAPRYLKALEKTRG